MDICHGRGPLIQVMLGLSFITLIVKSLSNFSFRLENLSASIVPHSQSLQYFAESRSKEIPQAARMKLLTSNSWQIYVTAHSPSRVEIFLYFTEIRLMTTWTCLRLQMSSTMRGVFMIYLKGRFGASGQGNGSRDGHSRQQKAGLSKSRTFHQ